MFAYVAHEKFKKPEFKNAERMYEKTIMARKGFQDDIIECLQEEINAQANKGIEYAKIRFGKALNFDSGCYYLRHYREDFIEMLRRIFSYFTKKGYEIDIINKNNILDNKPFDSLCQYNALCFIISWHKEK